MPNISKQSTIFYICAVLIFFPFSHDVLAQNNNMFGNQTNAETMLVDFVIVRPMGIAATAVGAAMFIASAPFAAFGGNVKQAYRKLIAEPAIHAFKRPLGSF